MPMAVKAKFGQIGSGSVVRRLARTRKKKAAPSRVFALRRLY